MAEVDGLTLLLRHGFERFVVNDRVRLATGRVVEFDVHFPGLRCAVEWDSAVHHGAPTERDRDADRDAATAADGYRTLRIRAFLRG